MPAITDHERAPRPWRHLGRAKATGTALALGALLALSYLPYTWSALTPVPLAALFLLTHRAPHPRAAFTRGYWSGVGFFAVLLAWLPISFTHLFGPAMIAPMPLVPFALAAFWGLTAWAARLAGPRTLLALPFAWTVMEYLRGLGPFGFTWGTMGYAFLPTPMIQIAALGGVYLVSLIVTLAAAALAALAARAPERGGLAMAAATALAAAALYGLQAKPASGPERTVLLVQGSIDPLRKAAGRTLDELDTYVRLTDRGRRRSPAPIDLIVWPETASPLPLDDPRALRAVAPFQTPAIIGAPSYRDGYQNSAYAVDGGASVGRYNKVRLVPFGEYFPLRRTLAFAYDPLFTAIGLPGLTSATPGSTFEPLRLGDIVAGTYICYESTFPSVARSMAAGGANLLVNISNDAWFGRTQGAEQHFQMGRVRAIETRRYLVRAGNDGISAVIDSRGRVVQRFPRGARDAYPVTVQLQSHLTPYVRWGDWPVAAAGIAMIALLTIGLAARGRTEPLPELRAHLTGHTPRGLYTSKTLHPYPETVEGSGSAARPARRPPRLHTTTPNRQAVGLKGPA